MPDNYCFKGTHLHHCVYRNLTISNNYGSIKWLEDLDLESVDFKSAVEIDYKAVNFNSEVLERPCEATLRGMPGSMTSDSKTAFDAFSRNIQKTGATLLEVNKKEQFFRVLLNLD